jgi:hypothetical protein
MEREIYTPIIETLANDKVVKEMTKIGLCRRWTIAAMALIRTHYPEITAEAREVDLTPHLQHTFLKISIAGEKPFFWDGVGTLKFQPFSGFEEDAPPHLQNSRSDMINNI